MTVTCEKEDIASEFMAGTLGITKKEQRKCVQMYTMCMYMRANPLIKYFHERLSIDCVARCYRRSFLFTPPHLPFPIARQLLSLPACLAIISVPLHLGLSSVSIDCPFQKIPGQSKHVYS